MIEENVKNLCRELKDGNCFGEPVTLVAATKTRTPDEIRRAIDAGISDVGENRVQEFCDKFDAAAGANRHFIGHLQTNKIKYLVGKVYLLHSLDRDALADALDLRCRAAGVVQDVLVQINIGNEETKSGYPLEEGLNAYGRLRARAGLRPVGFMAMLPAADDTALLSRLADRMRALFDEAKMRGWGAKYLSMGMSGDWRLCLAHGANMIRLGSAIFGERT